MSNVGNGAGYPAPETHVSGRRAPRQPDAPGAERARLAARVGKPGPGVPSSAGERPGLPSPAAVRTWDALARPLARRLVVLAPRQGPGPATGARRKAGSGDSADLAEHARRSGPLAPAATPGTPASSSPRKRLAQSVRQVLHCGTGDGSAAASAAAGRRAGAELAAVCRGQPHQLQDFLVRILVAVLDPRETLHPGALPCVAGLLEASGRGSGRGKPQDEVRSMTLLVTRAMPQPPRPADVDKAFRLLLFLAAPHRDAPAVLDPLLGFVAQRRPMVDDHGRHVVRSVKRADIEALCEWLGGPAAAHAGLRQLVALAGRIPELQPVREAVVAWMLAATGTPAPEGAEPEAPSSDPALCVALARDALDALGARYDAQTARVLGMVLAPCGQRARSRLPVGQGPFALGSALALGEAMALSELDLHMLMRASLCERDGSSTEGTKLLLGRMLDALVQHRPASELPVLAASLVHAFRAHRLDLDKQGGRCAPPAIPVRQTIREHMAAAPEDTRRRVALGMNLAREPLWVYHPAWPSLPAWASDACAGPRLPQGPLAVREAMAADPCSSDRDPRLDLLFRLYRIPGMVTHASGGKRLAAALQDPRVPQLQDRWRIAEALCREQPQLLLAAIRGIRQTLAAYLVGSSDRISRAYVQAADRAQAALWRQEREVHRWQGLLGGPAPSAGPERQQALQQLLVIVRSELVRITGEPGASPGDAFGRAGAAALAPSPAVRSPAAQHPAKFPRPAPSPRPGRCSPRPCST